MRSFSLPLSAPFALGLVGLFGVPFLLVPRASAQSFDATPAPTDSASAPLPPLPPLPPPPAPAPSATTSPTPSPIVYNVVVNNAAPVAAESTTTDHDAVVGRLGLAYFGQFDVPLGFTGARSSGATVPVQMLGIHYWLSRVRLDVAFGIDTESGSEETTQGRTPTASVDQATTIAFAFRLRAPVALYTDRHYTLFVGPELNYGHAEETVHARHEAGVTPPPDTLHTGNRTAFGVRAGAEIHFGFLGLPRLSLDATMGLLADLTNGNTAGPTPGGYPGDASDLTFHHFSVQSTIGHQPWNIFISNVAASYYF